VFLFSIFRKAPWLGLVMFLALFVLSVLLTGGTIGLLVEAVQRLDPGVVPHAIGILLSIALLCIFALLAWKTFETGLFLMLSFIHLLFGNQEVPARVEQAYAAKRAKVRQKLEAQ
jgi:hypothetical protein